AEGLRRTPRHRWKQRIERSPPAQVARTGAATHALPAIGRGSTRVLLNHSRISPLGRTIRARASARSENACAAGTIAVRAPVQATPQCTSVGYPDRARPSARYNSGPANSATPISHSKSHPAKAEPRLVARAPAQPTVDRLQPTASKGPNTNGTARIEQIAAAPQSTPSRRDVRPGVRRSKAFMSQRLSCVCKCFTGIPLTPNLGPVSCAPRCAVAR
ncbi:MAG: hypothetical protein QOI44_2311, partial [Actinomycetota bacterium]|nr:hypothetical protein [Actinomycetota bacterium]